MNILKYKSKIMKYSNNKMIAKIENIRENIF